MERMRGREGRRDGEGERGRERVIEKETGERGAREKDSERKERGGEKVEHYCNLMSCRQSCLPAGTQRYSSEEKRKTYHYY